MNDLPTRPWSGWEVDVEMRQLIVKTNDAVAEFRSYARKAAAATHAAKKAEAKAWLQAKADKTLTSDPTRKAWVYNRTGDLQHEADLADGEMAAQRLLIASMHHEADLLRSLARSNRDMHDSPGWGGQSNSSGR